MDDAQLQRQSRHALLEGFDEEGVLALGQARALIIGAGGLGCPAATYLVTGGIGTLHWVDGDAVDMSNLARQTLFGPADVGRSKVLAGRDALLRLSPQTNILSEPCHADRAFLDRAVPQADVVLDCTDQWAIRQEINAACVRHAVPLVSASALQWSGQLMVVDPAEPRHACYACVFDPQAQPDDAACGAFGVLGPLVGAMGCLQAAEAMKLLIRRAGTSAPQKSASQKLTMVDMRSGSCQQLEIARNPDCPVCGPSEAGAQPRLGE